MKALLFAMCVFGALAASSTTITITDDEPATKNIELVGGDTLDIRGNGLTANCTVTIVCGYSNPAIIQFSSTATIAAPISLNDSAHFMVAAGVTGTVAGKLTATGTDYDAQILSTVESGGLLRFTGGAELAAKSGAGMYSTFRPKKGEIEIADKPFETTYSLSFLGGHLTVKDGGAWTAGKAAGAGLYLNRGEQSSDATFEIGVGGSATFGSDQSIYIAYASGKTSKIYVNGGTLAATTGDHFYFNHNTSNAAGGKGTGIFEIDNGGVYSTVRHVEVGSADTGSARVVLGDGTWAICDSTYGEPANCLFAQTHASGGDLQVTVGGDFTFDFAKAKNYSVFQDRAAAGTYPELDFAWAVAEGAKLTFGGRTGSSTANFTISNLQPEGRFDLGILADNPTSLTLANASENLHFGVTLPLPSGRTITATGTSPAATVDLSYVSSETEPAVLSDTVLNASSLVGFGSLAFGDRFAFNGTATGTLYVEPALSSGFSSVKVGSGRLILKDASSIPATTVVETSGSGALALVNATGFDPETRMAGTKNLTDIASDLVITDTARTDAVAVGNGQTLLVYGDGLGEEASVSLAAGATLKFMASATIAGPVNAAAGTTTIRAAAGAFGTIAGKFTQSGTTATTINLYSEGLINFIGGGEISNGPGSSNTPAFCVRTGEVQITNKAFSVGCSMDLYSGRLRIADGGSWTPFATYCPVNLNKSQTGDVCLEVGKGGLVRLGNNCHYYIGSNAQTTYASKLFINGGTVRRDGADHFSLRGCGVVEIDNGGTLATSRLIEVGSTTGAAKVILGNGAWTGNNEWAGNNDYTSLFAQESGVGASTCAVSLAGDFTVDISHYTNQNIANDAGGVSNWSVGPGARLHVVGHGANTKKLKFVNFAGEGLALDLNATSNTDVVFDNVPETVTVGFVLPGKTSSRIQATTTEPDLHVGYVVPNGQTYELGTTAVNLTTTGFNSVTRTDDLTLDAGSTVVIPWNGAGSPYVLDGSLRLPDETATVNYKLKRNAPVGKQDGTVILNANEIVGNPSWVCVGGAQADRATLAVEGDSLVFGYDPPGVVLIVR